MTTPLADAAAWTRLRAAAARIPAPLTRYVYLESWLRDGLPRLDLIVKLEAAGLELLAAPPPPLLEGGRLAGPGWDRLCAFARAWRDGLRADVDCLWLEFDLDGAGPHGGEGEPRLFVDFRTHGPAAPSADGRRTFRRALEPLCGREAAASAAERLAPCLDALPDGASVPYLGLAEGDGMPIVRVCARGLGANLAGYLGAVGWGGDAGDLTEAILEPMGRAKRCRPAEAASVLHLDLGPETRRRIGLEIAFTRAGQARGELRDAAILDELVARRWCGADRRDALRGWPGSFVTLMAHEVWHSRVTRRVGHVKLTYATGEPIEAKAYLCFSHTLARGGAVVGSRPVRPGPSPADDGAPALFDGSGPRPDRARRSRPRPPGP